MKQDQVKQVAAGDVVLKVDRIDANRRVCPAGTQIAPNVEGWPSHRVQHEVFHGYAEKGIGRKPSHPATPEPKIDRTDVEKLVKKVESLQEDKRALNEEVAGLKKELEMVLAQVSDLNKQLADAKAEKAENKKPKG